MDRGSDELIRIKALNDAIRSIIKKTRGLKKKYIQLGKKLKKEKQKYKKQIENKAGDKKLPGIVHKIDMLKGEKKQVKNNLIDLKTRLNNTYKSRYNN